MPQSHAAVNTIAAALRYRNRVDNETNNREFVGGNETTRWIQKRYVRWLRRKVDESIGNHRRRPVESRLQEHSRRTGVGKSGCT